MPLPLMTPGELITASKWNDVTALVNNLEVRLALLEKGGTGLRITQVLPPGIVTAGDTIRISGSGFDFTRGGQSVFFGSSRGSEFGSDSSDSLLIVKIPDVVNGATPSGASITMTVGNLNEFVTWPLTIKSRPVLVGGGIEFGYLNSSPAAPAANAPITYNFRLASLSNVDLTITIAPNVQLGGAAVPVEVHDSDGQLRADKTIPLPTGVSKVIGLTIAQVPNVANGTTFTVTATASAVGIQPVADAAPLQTVGVAGDTPDPTIANLTFNKFDTPGDGTFAGPAVGDQTDGTISIPGNTAKTVTIFLDTTFSQIPVGSIFKYFSSATVVTGVGWTANPNALEGNEFDVAGPGEQDFPAFDINAPAAGQATIQFTLTRQGLATNNKRSATFLVKRT